MVPHKFNFSGAALYCLFGKILPSVNAINQCIMKIKFNKDTINTLYNMLRQKPNFADLEPAKNYIIKNDVDQNIDTLNLEEVVVTTPDGIKLNTPVTFTAKKGDFILLKGSLA